MFEGLLTSPQFFFHVCLMLLHSTNKIKSECMRNEEHNKEFKLLPLEH